jgi:5'-3' exonuclease
MLLLIDLSYFIFYRYYAVYNWYKKQNQPAEAGVAGEAGAEAGAAAAAEVKPKNQSVMSDPLFIEKYDKLFEQVVSTLVKKHEISWNNVYFAKDCSRDEIWRMSHYPAYKQSREERLDTFDKMIFYHSIAILIPQLQKKYGGCHILSIDHMEADDIVAVTKKYVRDREPEREIIIVTNDNDYIQLIDDYTLIVNLQGYDLKSRIRGTPAEYLKQKIILGDKADNIPSIAKKIGEKTSFKLSNDDDALAALFKKNPDAKKQFDLNTLLISFEQIPAKYQKLAIESYIKTI